MKNSTAFLHKFPTVTHNLCEAEKTFRFRSCTISTHLVTQLIFFHTSSIKLFKLFTRAPVLVSCLLAFAMDPSQQQMHHHLARALMHLNLNHLAGFFPFFQPSIDWESHPASMPSANPISTSRHLHTFVPLPSSSTSASLATHGGLPSQMVFNPEPHFSAISYPTPSEDMPPPSSIGHRPDGTGTVHSGNTFNIRTRASSSTTTSSMPPASSINPQQASSSAHPDIRSTKRQRIAAMMTCRTCSQNSPHCH